MASRYRDAKRGQSRPSNSPLESRAAHVPSNRGPWRPRQKQRGPMSRVKRSRAARTMHSLQTLQGIEQRQINRDSRALKGGASAPFFLCPPGPWRLHRGPRPDKIKLRGRRVAGPQSRRVYKLQAGPQGAEQRRRVREPRPLGRRDAATSEQGPLIPLKQKYLSFLGPLYQEEICPTSGPIRCVPRDLMGRNIYCVSVTYF